MDGEGYLFSQVSSSNNPRFSKALHYSFFLPDSKTGRPFFFLRVGGGRGEERRGNINDSEAQG